MSRLKIASPTKADIVMEGLYKDLERRIEASPPGLCPVDMARAFLELCHAQTCGKCVPCREGTRRMLDILEKIVAGNGEMSDLEVLEQLGKMPLPPYMKRDAEISDCDRYQTVYADPIGSMAAPTAGLHFTPELLNEISARGAEIVNITLHVGAGTWMPVKTENLSEHKMHSEWGCITPAQAEIINSAKRVIAVGTTSLRLLESAAMRNKDQLKYKRVAPFCDTTDIFITPGYKFGAVDVLLTNFHLPCSTLLMLVSCFCEREMVIAAYRKAVENKMRFYSYGDCMLLK